MKKLSVLLLVLVAFIISGFLLGDVSYGWCPVPTSTPIVVPPTVTVAPTAIPTDTPAATTIPTTVFTAVPTIPQETPSTGGCTGVLGAALIPIPETAYPSNTPFMVYVMTEAQFTQVLLSHSAAGIVPIGSPYYTGAVDPVTAGKIDVIECSQPRNQNYLIENLYWFDAIYMVYIDWNGVLVPSVMYGMFARTDPLAGILWYDSSRWTVAYNPNP